MALTHLVDTSVFTRLRNPAVLAALRPLLESGATARAAMTDLEVGFSARNEREWDELHDDLEICAPLEILPVDFARALTVQRLLAAAGRRGRKLPGLLTAAVAERQRLIVLHYDRDYDYIAGVTGQTVAWVVPAGTVD